MKEFAVRQAVLDTERTKWRQVLLKGGHTDDDAMFRLTNVLARHEIGVTIATGTNSDARDLATYSKEELPDVRWEEALRSGTIGGVAQVKRLEVPDGRLHRYKREAIAFMHDIVDEIDPIAIVSMHPGDEHPDHRAAYAISQTVAEKNISLYSTDTITGYDRFGRPLKPSLYIPLTEEIEEIERQTYLANTSQVDNLPPEDEIDRDNVIDMTARRAKEMRDSDVSFAAVLFEANNTRTSSLREVLVYAHAA